MASPIETHEPHRGHDHANGHTPTNAAHRALLTTGAPGWAGIAAGDPLIGRDPRAIPVADPIESGHPPRETRSLVAAMGDVPGLGGIRTYRDIGAHCATACAGSRPAALACAIYDCPFWSCRTGRNPHRPPMSDAAREAARERMGAINAKIAKAPPGADSGV